MFRFLQISTLAFTQSRKEGRMLASCFIPPSAVIGYIGARGIVIGPAVECKCHGGDGGAGFGCC